MSAPIKTCWKGPVVYHTVEQIDHRATGEQMRTLRTAHHISVREVARRMKLSAPFVSDLERGRRNWDVTRALAYMSAVTMAQIAAIQKAVESSKNSPLNNLRIGSK